MAGISVGARNGSSSHILPELLTQITQGVIKQLQTGGLDEEMPLRPSQNSFPPFPLPHPRPQPIPQSPSNAPGMPLSMPHRVYDPPSPHHPLFYPSHGSPQSKPGKEQKAATHFPRRKPSPASSQSSETIERYYTRPKGSPDLSTDTGITKLERIWGPLFDEEGRPTRRVGQLLRGLAMHIVRIACGGSIGEVLSSIDFAEETALGLL